MLPQSTVHSMQELILLLIREYGLYTTHRTANDAWSLTVVFHYADTVAESRHICSCLFMFEAVREVD